MPEANSRGIAARDSPRFAELDSLRGLAAISVVFGHLAEVILSASPAQSAQWSSAARMITDINWTPLCLFTSSGGQAVRFFFLLSGFVLTLPFLKRGQPYVAYALKRICRIYTPYLLALLAAIAANSWYGNYPLDGFGPFVQQTWGSNPSAYLVLQHVLMLGNYDCGRFNTVFWSLIQEMRVSLIFPIIAYLVIKLSERWPIIMVCLGLELSSLALTCAAGEGTFGLASFAYMPHIIVLFIVGGTIAKHRESIVIAVDRVSGRHTWVLVAFLVTCYGMGPKLVWGNQFLQHVLIPLKRMNIFPNSINERLIDQLGLLAGDWLAAGSAALLIAVALGNNAFRSFLRSRALVLCGLVSYSLYLAHGTVLWSLLYLLQPATGHSVYVFGCLYICVTAIATGLLYRFVERPSIALGRFVSNAVRMT